MSRLARVVIAGIPHHVTQRGNRRQRTFFRHEDYATYRELMAEWCRARGVDVWAYSLMPNHVHLIAVPGQSSALRLAIGEAHRRYTRHVNFREQWRGHLWQGRFASFPMSEEHLANCVRYVELNPVRAGLVRRPEEWPFSSASAHLAGRDDALVQVSPLLERVDDWSRFLGQSKDEDLGALLRQHESTGRPMGDDEFVIDMERRAGRRLRVHSPGRRPAALDASSCTPGNAYGVVSPPRVAD